MRYPIIFSLFILTATVVHATEKEEGKGLTFPTAKQFVNDPGHYQEEKVEGRWLKTDRLKEQALEVYIKKRIAAQKKGGEDLARQLEEEREKNERFVRQEKEQGEKESAELRLLNENNEKLTALLEEERKKNKRFVSQEEEQGEKESEELRLLREQLEEVKNKLLEAGKLASAQSLLLANTGAISRSLTETQAKKDEIVEENAKLKARLAAQDDLLSVKESRQEELLLEAEEHSQAIALEKLRKETLEDENIKLREFIADIAAKERDIAVLLQRNRGHEESLQDVKER